MKYIGKKAEPESILSTYCRSMCEADLAVSVVYFSVSSMG